MKLNLRSRAGETSVRFRESEAPSLQSPSQRVCLVCSVKEASYCCPRCFKPYCSVVCFKNHDIICTEEFSREKVEAVLAREREQNEAESPSRSGAQGVEVSIRSSNGSDSDSDDSQTDEFDDVESRMIEDLASKMSTSEVTYSDLSPAERRVLKKVSNSASSRRYMRSNRRRPCWEDGSLDLEQRHLLHREVRRVLGCVAELSGVSTPEVSAQDSREDRRKDGHNSANNSNNNSDNVSNKNSNRSSSSSSSSSSSNENGEDDPLQYQLLGLLLGYVTAVRTLSGESGEDEESEEEKCEELFSLLLQSTPFLEAKFRPFSVDGCVQGWLQHRPPSLPSLASTSRLRATQGVVEDVAKLLSSPELVMFALLDCWRVSHLCFLKAAGVSGTAPPLAGKVPWDGNGYSEGLCPMLREFHSVFQHRTPSGAKGADKSAQTCDRFRRKCFFLVRHFVLTSYQLDDCVETLRESLRSYATEVLSDIVS